ncbi:MAG TPA: heme-copper oxidase subunit III [Acidobacteriaceae bacterium]|nr:heme-copper oxidase subunit III [Acidobacteriaceae bacterium]
MSAIPVMPGPEPWELPSKGRVGMLSLIIGECGIFTIFVVAYVFYIGKSLNGPTPQQVLDIPIFNTICLLSSSVTIWLAERQIERGKMKAFAALWALTIGLGLEFILGTAMEWDKLIRGGLTVRTNLFGTTFYALVGLHATHVVVGLIGLSLILIFTLTGHVSERHTERIQVFALYWHFVDAVWVVVFTVVYIVGR